MTDTVLEEENINHPLKQRVIGKLIYLEEMFYQRMMDVEVVSDLCKIYGVTEALI